MKPGIKTTEFALTMLAVLLGGLAPFLAAGSVLEKVVGLIVAGLAAIGYGVGRSVVKSSAQTASAVQSLALHDKASPPSP